jgi:hypothetical protein
MSEEHGPDSVVLSEGYVAAGTDHGGMPFRLRDFAPIFAFSKLHELAAPLDRLQCEVQFQTKLAIFEWDKRHWITMALGAVAFLLGSLSPEIMSGGDPMLIGAEGIQSVSSGVFLQMIISAILWVWFAVQIWSLFPIMRTHAISLLVFWNLFIVAQLLYHNENPTFPVGVNPSQMMMGTLVVLVVLFFIYFFWKAVSETRDLHIEEYHLHEDVRLMEMEMAEHSLSGWGLMLATWTGTTTLSSWAGAHFVADQSVGTTGTLIIHIVFGLLSLPVFMMVIWYPQRMLGQDTVVRTKAAIAADAELMIQTATASDEHHGKSVCPECNTEVGISRSKSGEIMVPCATEGCNAQSAVGKACQRCKSATPTRYDCPSCGINAPVLDFLSDVEVW